MLYIRAPTRTEPESISAPPRKSLTKSLIFWKLASVTLVDASSIKTRSVFASSQPLLIIKHRIRIPSYILPFKHERKNYVPLDVLTKTNDLFSSAVRVLNCWSTLNIYHKLPRISNELIHEIMTVNDCQYVNISWVSSFWRWQNCTKSMSTWKGKRNLIIYKYLYMNVYLDELHYIKSTLNCHQNLTAHKST